MTQFPRSTSDPCGCHKTLAAHNDAVSEYSDIDGSAGFQTGTIELWEPFDRHCHGCWPEIAPSMMLLLFFALITALLLRFRRRTHYITFRGMVSNAYPPHLNSLAREKLFCTIRNCLIPVHLHELLAEKRCAYCKDLISESSQIFDCPSCATAHHSDCYVYHTGCAVFGCRSAGSIRAS